MVGLTTPPSTASIQLRTHHPHPGLVWVALMAACGGGHKPEPAAIARFVGPEVSPALG